MIEKNKILLFDTTLRDGTQTEGISISIADKLEIVKLLDWFGVDYIEGGWPGSNIKDVSFFQEVKKLNLKSTIVAFGSTRKKNIPVDTDKNLLSIVASGVSTACIFGKSWDFHVKHALQTSLEENLNMIHDSVSYLVSNGLQVIYDAEHFFDAYQSYRDYAMKTIHTAFKAGAINITLCDTNGGILPNVVHDTISYIRGVYPDMPLGIHAHNDAECAVANSLLAVETGVKLVQGTINGYGERCGNANLCSVIPSLKLKMQREFYVDISLSKLVELSRKVSEIMNQPAYKRQPYVGSSAFSHKGGIHVSAILKNPSTYEHIDPNSVGNDRNVLVSELSGKANIIYKMQKCCPQINFDFQSPLIDQLIHEIKQNEHQGLQYEGADASFILLIYKRFSKYISPFSVCFFRMHIFHSQEGIPISEAVVKLIVDGCEKITVSESVAPLEALNNALIELLSSSYPSLKQIQLINFKVRIIDSGKATRSKVRVWIQSQDHKMTWGTVAVSDNVVQACWEALLDSINYKLCMDGN